MLDTSRQYRIVQTAAPAVEPVTLAEAKLHLRVDHADENDHISSLIVAARQLAETYTRRVFVNTTFRLTLDEWPVSRVIRTPGGRLQSVSTITYTDVDGDSQTLASSQYTVDTDSEPGRIVEVEEVDWPGLEDSANAVKVTFVAGYGAAATAVPDAVKAAIKLIVGNLYERRESTISGTIIAEVPMAANALLDTVRVLEFF